MRFTRTSSFLVVITLLAPTAALLAQQAIRVPEPRRGLVVGQVLDEDGPVVGVAVHIVGTSIVDTSDFLGHFRLSKISPGTHKLSARALGYMPYHLDSLSVQTNAITEVVVHLRSAPVPSSAEMHTEEYRKALFAFDADTSAGRIILISPFEIAREESSFAREYGFTFQKNRWSRVFMDSYNAQSHRVLMSKHGKGFSRLLDSLWDIVHRQR